MKSVTVSGKTIEKAIEEGLKLLNTTFENVDITVISEGGFLKKATVEVSLSEDYKTEKQEKLAKLEKLEKLEKQETAKKEAVKPAKAKPETKPEPVLEEGKDEKLEDEIKNLEKQLETFTEEKPSEKGNDEEQTKEAITEFLTGLLNNYGMLAKIEVEHKGKEYYVSIVGENLGVLIGYHGESLDAIQYILSNVVFNKFGKNHKIILDIENYRGKRAEALQTMADSLVKRVLEAKRSFKLEPMNSFERKVIHSHLQDMEHITTHSEGEEPKRYLVIDYVA